MYNKGDKVRHKRTQEVATVVRPHHNDASMYVVELEVGVDVWHTQRIEVVKEENSRYSEGDKVFDLKSFKETTIKRIDTDEGDPYPIVANTGCCFTREGKYQRKEGYISLLTWEEYQNLKPVLSQVTGFNTKTGLVDNNLEVGDKVYCSYKKLNGVLERIDRHDTDYPYCIRYEDNDWNWYTGDGRFRSGQDRCLSHI